MSRQKSDPSGSNPPENDLGSLRRHDWPRFLRGPDTELLEKLYVPALSEAVRYDRCCAYFSSSVLAAAARGFARLISRLVSLEEAVNKPSVRLVVNEELSEEDVRALIETGDTSVLEESLLKRLKTPKDLLEKQRLGMLAWLAKSGLLAVRVGILRQGQGIVHAKFGLMYDAAGDAVVFSGSGNESAHGLRANYERLEVSSSWTDEERFREYRDEFGALWKDAHPDVHTVSLPEAVQQKLIKLAPPEPPLVEPADNLERRKAAMLWRFIAEAPFLPNGASCCDATAPLEKLWPHQVHVIEEATNSWPEGRLLCDEVGMGKTIEAIMILRRLLAGRGVERVLLLLPAGLTNQWQEELREKGGLIVPRLQNTDTLFWPDGRVERVSSLAEALEQNLLIMSRETARTENNQAVLLAAQPWDLVLLDEAHAARRAKQEEGEFNSATLLLGMLRQLQMRQKAKGFLFLSATPMQTVPWEPWDLLAVLGEGGGWLSDFEGIRGFYDAVHHLKTGFSPSPESARRTAWLVCSDKCFTEPPKGFPLPASSEDCERRFRFVPPAQKSEVAEWLRRGSPLPRRMHRNTRQTLRGYFQRGLITDLPPTRIVVDWPYDFQPPNGPERKVYDAVGRYIERRFEELEREKSGKGFVMTVYRRRAASSPYALKCSLQRRLDGLNRVINQRASSDYMEPSEGPAGLLDSELSEEIDPRAISASLPSSPDEAKREAAEVAPLFEQLKALGATDTKRDRFFDLIRSLVGEGRPVLVFTEYADTMDYLRDNLATHYTDQVASYSGNGGAFYRDGGWQTVTKKEITEALTNGRIRFLVCTDAASEGLNLQTASALINYDLPWNPSRVEQRIGRIDRIGQREREVKIYNFFLKNSIDERVYGALQNRCGLFKHFVGPMQPVLARAQVMLNRPQTFSLEEIERVASEVEKNILNAETYLDSEVFVVQETKPPVKRNDIYETLKMLGPEFGLHVNFGKVAIIKGLYPKAVRIALDSETLDSDPSAQPLTALSPLAMDLADHLGRPGELLPLVIDSHRHGVFRSSSAVWVGPEGLEPMGSYGELQARLEGWDGSLPDPDRMMDAKRYAQQEAERNVQALESQAAKRLTATYARQREAVLLRTARELGRLVKCLDPDGADLKSAITYQASRGGPLAQRINEALKRIGPNFDWTSYLEWEINLFAKELTPNEIRSRLTGSSLDAALSDYRWQAGNIPIS